MRPVRIKSVEQQALQGMHRIRSMWMGTRTSRINALRGVLPGVWHCIPVGARTGIEAISRVLADPYTAVPDLIRGTARLLIKEVRPLKARVAQLERELTALARLSPACPTLLSIPGIGLLTATAMVLLAKRFVACDAGHRMFRPGATTTRRPANKLARICYATLRDKAPFGEGQRLNKKINRESFVMPA